VSQRAARTQTEQAAMQGTLRTGLQIAMSEISEIWTDQPAATPTSAITNMTATQLTYEAARGFGISCSAPIATAMYLRKSTYSGVSYNLSAGGPAALQGMYIFDEGASDQTQNDDAWHDFTISNVTPGSCADGQPAWVVEVTSNIPAGVLATLKWPGPVRIHESTVLGLVAADGRNWLGIGTSGAGLTPLAGPLTTAGLSFSYRDASNAVTGNPNNVKSIVLKLYGEVDRAANQGLSGNVSLLSDSITVRIQLRNGR